MIHVLQGKIVFYFVQLLKYFYKLICQWRVCLNCVVALYTKTGARLEHLFLITLRVMSDTL